MSKHKKKKRAFTVKSQTPSARLPATGRRRVITVRDETHPCWLIDQAAHDAAKKSAA